MIADADVTVGGEPVSTALVDALATDAGVDPMDLDEPLYDSVDLDALEMLFEHGTGPLEVSFRYQGVPVTVSRDRVEVDGRVYPRGNR